MAKNIAIAILAFALVVFAGCAGQAKGEITGKVTVGPLCPVEPCNLDPAQIALAYTNRNVTVYSGSTMVKQMPLNTDGSYRMELAPGTYSVAITPAGMRAMEPKEVVVNQNQETTLDFEIDTGIR